MNQENEISLAGENARVIPDSTQEPGVLLRTAREKANLSLETVADQLNLTTQVIVDLEMNQYHRISALVFVRGYLRAYAKLLNLDPELVLEKFDQLGIPEKQTKLSSDIFQNQPHDHNKEQFFAWSLGVIAIILLIASFFWWRSEHNSKSELSNSSTVLVSNKLLTPLNNAKDVNDQTQNLKGEPNPVTTEPTPVATAPNADTEHADSGKQLAAAATKEVNKTSTDSKENNHPSDVSPLNTDTKSSDAQKADTADTSAKTPAIASSDDSKKKQSEAVPHKSKHKSSDALASPF